MEVEFCIVIIGDEILLGQVADTNTSAIIRALAPAGFRCRRVLTVGDNAADIRSAINSSMELTPLVITTGGLGPTKDDITRGALMEIFGGTLNEDPAVTANIEQVFSRRGLQLNPLTRLQAWVPDTARVLMNRFGTAPGLLFMRKDGKNAQRVICLPGVPSETAGMLPDVVVPTLIDEFHAPTDTRHISYIVAGISESALAQRLETFENALPAEAHLAYLPNGGWIHLRLDISGGSEELARELSAGLEDALGIYLLCHGYHTPAEILINLLRERKLTLATAESCTGGNIAHDITSVPGSSDVFKGAVVSYANSIKENILGVDPQTLDSLGAVSLPVAKQMAIGALRELDTDCAISTTGIAGPGGGSDEKPVGTVWLCISTPQAMLTHCLHLNGSRLRIIERTTTEAIIALIRLLKNPSWTF